MRSNLILAALGILLCTAASFFTPVRADNDLIILDKGNHIVFSGTVTEESASKAQLAIGKLSAKLPRNATIYLVIDSPGGSVTAGNAFIDFANSLPQTIRPICIFCASMGYHMFQSFDQRIVQPSSSLMSHRARLSGLAGQVPGELETRLRDIKESLLEMDIRVAKRVGTSVEDYQKLIHDELWLSGTKAIEKNHADVIRKIKCSSDLLNGTKQETVQTFIGPVDITLSTCPLVSGILAFKFKREMPFQSIKLVKKAFRETRRSVKWSL